MTISDLSSPDDTLARGNCFKLLAACFYEPEKDLLLEEGVCDTLRELLEKQAPAAAASAGTMQNCLVELTPEQLKVDYAALFVGPFELIAAPYGSIYLEQQRTVMGESTLQVQRFYDAADLQLEIQEPPDHIAIELEFMYLLCSREAEAIVAGDMEQARYNRELQLDFARTMMGWVPAFTKCIQKGAQTEYYRALASCLSVFFASFLATCTHNAAPSCNCAD